LLISFRTGFYGGLAIALCVGLYLIWLWQPERQVKRHAENFFHAIEHKNWDTAANFIAADYQDQWGNDRARVLERLREGFRYVRGARIIASNPSVQVEALRAMWSGKITLYSTDDDVMEMLDQRVNSLRTPFELEWHRTSGKPRDWKLARVSNLEFEIPADVSWGSLIFPAPGAIGSWQTPHRAAVVGKARSRGVYLPDSSAQ
jgi:hypothetical protein